LQSRREPRRRDRRRRPEPLGRAAPAPAPGQGRRRRGRGAPGRRADLRGRRPHRVPRRRAGRRGPPRTHHRRGHRLAAVADPRRPDRLDARGQGPRHRHPRRALPRRRIPRPHLSTGVPMSAPHTRLPVAGGAETIRAVKRLVLEDKAAFAGVVALYVAAAGASAALPVMLGEVIDGIGTGWTASRVDAVCAAIAGCVLAQLVLMRTGRRLGYRLGERAAARLRESFVDRVLRLPLGTVERAGTGDLATRTSGDVGAVAELLRKTGPEVAVAIIEIVVITVAAFVVGPALGLLFLVGAPALVIAGRRYVRLASPVFLKE